MGGYSIGMDARCKKARRGYLLNPQSLIGQYERADKLGIEVEEIDPCGSGDSFLAALCLSDYHQYPKESLFLANCWAGLSVKESGTSTPKKQELTNYIENLK